MASLPVLLFIPTKYQIISNGMGVIACIRIRGDNYRTKKVRVVSLAHDTPNGPPLYPYQILSNLLKQYGSYGLRMIFGFRGYNYITKKKKELSLLHVTCLLVLLFIPTKYYQNISKGIKVRHTRMCLLISASGEITT